MKRKLLLEEEVLASWHTKAMLGVPTTKIVGLTGKDKYQTSRRLLKIYSSIVSSKDDNQKEQLLANLFPTWLNTQPKEGLFYVVKDYKFVGSFPLGYWEPLNDNV